MDSPDSYDPPGKGRSTRISQVIEDHLRQRAAGESISDESLIAAHPELMPELGGELAKLRVIAAAQRHAERHEADTLRSTGLHIRCPHCHNRIELVADATLRDITCPSCGSSFNILGDEATTRDYTTLKALGHFELIEQLGTGQFGTVWMASDTELDRRVAIKIPRKGQLDATETELFLREARAAAQLRHPNIVSVHEVGREGDTIYIVSDFVRGVTLADWLTAQRATQREAAELCAKLADALQHAHQAGVIHRDLKPGNIMIDGDSQPHIMDFGLAKREAGEITMTVEGKIIGTPAYMSPEQAQGEAGQTDGRSDVYSLGVILFQLLTGELPFRGNARMLLHQVIHEPAPSPRKLIGSIPRDLETICLKCLEKEPRRRYDTAKLLADELRRWLGGEPIRARRIGPAARTWRWCKRNPVVAGLMATVASVLMIGTSVSMYFAVVATENAHLSKINADNARLAAETAERERIRADGLRLTAQSSAVLSDYPSLALLLAIEGGKRAPGLQSSNAILAALDARREQRTFYGASEAMFSPDSRKVVTARGAAVDSAARVWDIATGKGLLTLTGDHPVQSAIFSPDGIHIMTTELQDMLRVWDANTGRQLFSVRSTLDRVRGRKGIFRHDGQRMVIPADANTAAIFDVATGTKLITLIGHDRAVRLSSFSHDGKLVATAASDQTVRVWDAETGQQRLVLNWLVGQHRRDPRDLTRKLQLDQVDWVEFSPDDRWLLTDSEYVRVWDVESGQPRDFGPMYGTGGHVRFSPSGECLLVYSERSETVIVDNLNDRRRLQLMGHRFNVYDADFSPDGKYIVTAGFDQTVRIWDAQTGTEKAVLKGHTHPVYMAKFSPDGRLVVSGSGDGTVRIWSINSGSATIHANQRTSKSYSFIAPSPNGQYVLIPASPVRFSIWDFATRQQLVNQARAHDSPIRHAAYSPDGRLVATASDDKTAILWDAKTGNEVAALVGHEDSVNMVSFSRDGKHVVTASTDSTARVWNVNSGTLVTTLNGHIGAVHIAAFSPNAERVLTASYYDTTARIWDAADGRQLVVLAGHSGSVRDAEFSPDGRTALTVSSGRLPRVKRDEEVRWVNDPTARLWDVETGKQLLVIRHDDTASGDKPQYGVYRASFSPDGRRVLTVAKSARVWDAHSGKLLLVLKGREESLQSAAFVSDGQQVLTAEIYNAARLWDVATGKELATYDTPYGMLLVQVTTDHRWVVTVSPTGTIRRWPLNPLAEALRHKPRELSSEEQERFEITPVAENHNETATDVNVPSPH